jgi:heme-degrading monooxygenase HmoA
MIERHLTFQVHPERSADFERFFRDIYAPRVAASPGFVAVGLLREVDSPRYQMTMRWRDGEAAVTWRTSEVHRALQPELDDLHAGMEVVAYEVLA